MPSQSNYWRFGDYLAIGAGGHAKLSSPEGRISRTHKQRLPRLYQDLAGTDAAIAGRRDVDTDERPLEYLMNALRLTDGTSMADAQARTGLPASAFEPGLSEARRRGLMVQDPSRLQATVLGQRFLNDLLELFQ